MLASTDKNVDTIMHWERVARTAEKKIELQGWVLDEADAYRQIPVRPDHRQFSVIARKNPRSGKVNFFIMIGHSFGVVAAVYNYNRRSGLLNDMLWALFKVPASFFYDDKFGFEPKQTMGTAMKAVRWLHSRLGADFAEKKVQRGAEG